ncbi:MAG: DHH family phosphoesterase [Saccharofermentanales bacterium]
MAYRNDRLREIALAVGTKHTVAIFPHVGVDADCIGAGIALKMVLEKCGNTAHLFSDAPMADRFLFLPGSDKMIIYDNAADTAEFIRSHFSADTIDFGILEDCSTAERIGTCIGLLPFCAQTATIDHHFSEKCMAKLCCIDPDACATGELVYDFIRESEQITGIDLFDDDIATNIIAAIYFDTGGLRYSNTGAKAFGIASDLFARFRIDIRSISYNLFEKTAFSKLSIQAKAYNSIYFHAGNRIAISLITKKMIEECNASDDDIDGICNDLKNIEGVDAAFVLREKSEDEIRGNIRSSDLFDSSSFAAELGGGGHRRASGFTMKGMSIMDAYRIVAARSTERLLGTGVHQQ